MSATFVFIIAAGIAFVAGLRALTAPAVVSWAAYLGWLNLDGSPLAFMASGIAVAIFSLLAIVEFVGDVLPTTPSRTAPAPLIARVLMGGLSAACVCAAAGQSLLAGAAVGAIFALAGAFAGYQARTRLVRGLGVKDIFVAIPEDLVAAVCAFLLLSPR